MLFEAKMHRKTVKMNKICNLEVQKDFEQNLCFELLTLFPKIPQTRYLLIIIVSFFIFLITYLNNNVKPNKN